MTVRHEHQLTVVYLVGSGRSGSTLVERILGANDAAFNIGELNNIFVRNVLLNEGCGCGQPFDRCEFWTEVGKQSFGGWTEDFATHMVGLRRSVIRQRYLPKLLWAPSSEGSEPASAREYAQAFETMYSTVRSLSGKTLLVDASKDAVHGLYLRRLTNADLRPIQIVRDPRGVAFSWSKTKVERPNTGAEPRTMRTYTPAQSARMWNRENFWGSCLRAQGPSALLRYEEFGGNPLASLQAALAAAGLPLTLASALESDHLELPTSHGLSGNPNRFQTGPLTVRIDDAWKQGMPRKQSAAVALYTAPIRAHLTATSRASKHHSAPR